MANVAILGSTGMLGATMAKVLDENCINLFEFNRSGVSITKSTQAEEFDVIKRNNLDKIFKRFNLDYIVNCIGIVNNLINNKDQHSIDLAYKVNAEFPAALNDYSIKSGIPVITIGTDCVYSGKVGNYSEIDRFDPIDHYGISKSMGEKASTTSMVIRCSIIGRETNASNSLLEWLLTHPKDAVINGYINHIWNGITNLHFSQVVAGIIKNSNFKAGKLHLVPKDLVSKFELLRIMAREFGRADLRIDKFESKTSINRSLITTDTERNLRLWQDGGYNEIPTIEEMISTYSTWTQLWKSRY